MVEWVALLSVSSAISSSCVCGQWAVRDARVLVEVGVFTLSLPSLRLTASYSGILCCYIRFDGDCFSFSLVWISQACGHARRMLLSYSDAMFKLLLLIVLTVVHHSSANGSEESTYNSAEYYDLNVPPSTVKLDFVYHNHSALTQYLKDINNKYPTLTHLYSIGKSVRGLLI